MGNRLKPVRPALWIAAGVILVVLVLSGPVVLRMIIRAKLPPASTLYSESDRVRELFWAMIAAQEPDTWWALLWTRSFAWGPTINKPGLARMESRFGDMPEYWQLRYVLSDAQASRAYMEDNAKSGKETDDLYYDIPPGDITFLEKAVEVAPDDAVSLYLLSRMRYKNDDDNVTREEVLIESLRRCIHLDPDQAFYHYELARYLEILGEQEEALAELAAGNQALRNDYITYFPLSHIKRDYWAIDFLAGGLDYLYLDEWMNADPDSLNYIKVKDFAKEVVIRFNMSGDSEALNVFHRYAARLGKQRGAHHFQVHLAPVLMQVLQAGAREAGLFGEEDDKEQLRAYSRLVRLTGEAMGQMKGATAMRGHIGFSEIGGDVQDIRKYWPPIWLHRWYRTLWKAEYTMMEFHGYTVPEMFEALEDFDYTDPAAFLEEN